MSGKLTDVAVVVSFLGLVFAFAILGFCEMLMTMVTEVCRVFLLMVAISRSRSPGVLDRQNN